IAVRRRLGGRLGADDAACGRPVVDDERLPQRSFEMGRDEPRHHVVEAAGGEGNDQANRTAGVAVGPRADDAGEHDGEAQQQPKAGLATTALDHLAPDPGRATWRLPDQAAASFAISATTASPISGVLTTLAP